MLRHPHIKPICQCALLIAISATLMMPTNSKADNPPPIPDNPRVAGETTCSYTLVDGDIFIQRLRVNSPAHLDSLSIWYFAGQDTITPTISVLILDLFMRPMGVAVTSTIEPNSLGPVTVAPKADLGPGVFVISSTLRAPGWNGAGLIVDCLARYPETAELIYHVGGHVASRPMFFQVEARPWPEYVPPVLSWLPMVMK